MKKRILLIIGIALVAIIALLAWFRSYTKSHSPAAKAIIENREVKIVINYCQPYKKGRLIFGDETSGALQPYGKYWRIGANEATTFETNKPLMVNDQHLKVGKYSMYAYPGKEYWQIVFNSESERWGVPAPDPSNDIVKTNVPCTNNNPLEEQLVISLMQGDSNSIQMLIYWDQTKVMLPIALQK